MSKIGSTAGPRISCDPRPTNIMEFQDTFDANKPSEDGKKYPQNPQSASLAHDRAFEIDKDVEAAISSLESKFASFWSSASQSAQELQAKVNLEQRKVELAEQFKSARRNINNHPLVQENISSIENQMKEFGDHVKLLDTGNAMTSISSKANDALDTLDSKLEIVEQQAGKFVSLFTSFFSKIVSIDNPADDSLKQTEIYVKPTIPGPSYTSSRYDSDLFKLHTTEDFYLKPLGEQARDLNILGKTEEISELLAKYPDTLQKLMNKLVPVEVSYNDFWSHYFQEVLDLKDKETRRKIILSENVTDVNTNTDRSNDDSEGEDFTWDDDEEDDDDAEESGQKHTIVQKENEKNV